MQVMWSSFYPRLSKYLKFDNFFNIDLLMTEILINMGSAGTGLLLPDGWRNLNQC